MVVGAVADADADGVTHGVVDARPVGGVR